MIGPGSDKNAPKPPIMVQLHNKKRSHPIPVVKKEELNCPAKGVGEAPGKGHKPVPDDLQGGEALLLPNRHNPLHLEAGWLHSLQCF